MTSDDHDHQHCLEMFEKLSEYIDGELDHATCAEIEEHANNCVACFLVHGNPEKNSGPLQKYRGPTDPARIF